MMYFLIGLMETKFFIPFDYRLVLYIGFEVTVPIKLEIVLFYVITSVNNVISLDF